MKLFFALILAFIVISIIIMTGCGNREDLLESARVTQSEIPVVLTADPSTDCPCVPANPVVGVRFSKSMDTASVENAFSLTVSGEAYISGGSFEWLDENRMFIYYPASGSIPPGSLITARIEVSAQSIDGIHLSTPFEWSFTTGYNFYSGTPLVLSMLPQSFQVVLPSDFKIVIEFNRLMLHTTVESSFLLVSDSPDEGSWSSDNGSFAWENTASGEKVTFIPEQLPGNNHGYAVYLNNRGIVCRDLAGNALSNFECTFYTADTAIYVSYSGGDDANEGFHRTVPVQTIGKSWEKAKSYGFSLIKVEGSGGPGPDYTGSFSVPSGVSIEGGWNQSFDEKNRYTYSTTINSGSSQHTFILSGVSGCTLDSLSIWGGESTGTEDTAVFIENSSNISVQYSNILGPNQTTATQGYGIKIENSSNVILDSNDGISGGSTPYNAGVYVLGSSKNVTIKNNMDIMGIQGGATGISYGILLGTGTGPITIENNSLISGGSTSNKPTYGIYIDSGADVEIADNDYISGGTTSNSDTYGLFVNSGADVRIFRNHIIGGTSTPAASNMDYGLYVKQANECIVFNNFIRGSTDSSDLNNECYGVYANDTDIVLINNTIGSGGSPSGMTSSYTVCVSDNPWNINPYIVNNIFLEGTNNFNDGLRLIYGTPPIACRILNNSFRNDNIDRYIDGSGFNDTSISAVNSEINISPTPSSNEEFSSSDISFVDESTTDFHVSGISADTSSIKDNGYKTLSTLPLFTSNPSLLDELLIDIDGNTRNPATIDRGAHEFNP